MPISNLQRRDRDIYRVSELVLANQKLGPRSHCACCRRSLNDPESIQRGVGAIRIAINEEREREGDTNA